MDEETLAIILHEAGREAVEKGATVAAGNLGDHARRFIEWGELADAAKEGRRIQARYLISHGIGVIGSVGADTSAPASAPPRIDVSKRHIR